MNRKVGKFKLWQLLAVGGLLGFIIYEYEKTHKTGEQVGLAAATRPEAIPGGGGAEGGGIVAPNPAPGAPGEPGPPGATGAAAVPPSPAEIAAVTEPRFNELEARINGLNNPLTQSTKAPAAAKSKYPQINPRTGEHFRTIKEHGKTVHEYHNGRKVTVGGAKSNRKASNNKHQASKHGREKSHPANPNHHASHAAPVAAHQHARPKPIKQRVKHK